MSYSKKILGEVDHVIEKINEDDLKKCAKSLAAERRIFVAGQGRSGFMGKSFAMRLMHLGAHVFVIGETITPALMKEDLLIVVSGSGTTKSMVDLAGQARELGCDVIAVTANPKSALALESTSVINIPAATKNRGPEESATIQPLGSLFDQSLHIVLDTVCLYYSELQNVDHDTALGRHSNTE